LKVVILGNGNKYLDEGMNKVANIIYNKIVKVDGINAYYINYHNIKKIVSINPDIIHYVYGPSLFSLIYLKFLRFIMPKCKIIITTNQIKLPKKCSFLVEWFKPDFVICQSFEELNYFYKNNCKAKVITNGVDVSKFYPVNLEKKKELRKKYKIPVGKYIILHVGPIKKLRNIMSLLDLQERNDWQLLLIGSKSVGAEKDVKINMQNKGAIVIDRYIENIEEIYKLSDCYVFPTINKYACISTPLSVLEAASCNLPIVTTRFGSLPYIFNNTEGVYFYSGSKLKEVFNGIQLNNINTREKVMKHDWDMVIKKIVNIYREILNYNEK